MTTAQVTLTDSESQALQALSKSRGKTQEEILHEAIEQFLSLHPTGNRLAALAQARGIWSGRQGLPDLKQLRDEWNRF